MPWQERNSLIEAYLIRRGGRDSDAPPPRQIPEPDESAGEEEANAPFFEQLIQRSRTRVSGQKVKITWDGPRPVPQVVSRLPSGANLQGFSVLRSGVAGARALPAPGAAERGRHVREVIRQNFPRSEGEGAAEQALRERVVEEDLEEEEGREASAVGRMVSAKLGRNSRLSEADAIDTDEDEDEPPLHSPSIESAASARAAPISAGMSLPGPPPGPAARLAEEAPIVEMEDVPGEGVSCPNCHEAYAGEADARKCTSCTRDICTRCAVLKPGLEKTPYYAEFSFDLPLCEPCYETAFKIQELSGRALSCLGVGNLSYARRFAEAALQVDPRSKYNAKAVDLLERISRTQQDSKARDAEWAKARRKLLRAPDPAWHP